MVPSIAVVKGRNYQEGEISEKYERTGESRNGKEGAFEEIGKAP